MSIQLLDKTRKINYILHNNMSSRIMFNDICDVLSDVLASNIYVISKKGKVLGLRNRNDVPRIEENLPGKVGEWVDSTLNERLLHILSTKENVNLQTIGFLIDKKLEYQALITPISIMDARLGTLFLYRSKEPYDIEDIILSEYVTTIIGLAITHSEKEENDKENRNKQIVRSAINTLSFSELEAITYVFRELDGRTEGVLVASKIADKVGITRSVIVNALRKFESAGLIESHSSGMKGTYIKVLNDVAFKELKESKRLE